MTNIQVLLHLRKKELSINLFNMFPNRLLMLWLLHNMQSTVDKSISVLPMQSTQSML